MPFPIKIQPIQSDATTRPDQSKPVIKSRLKRLFRRSSSSENVKEIPIVGGGDLDLSSVALDKMVRSYLENYNNGRNNSSRCNCFHGGGDDDDFSAAGEIPIVSDAADLLKGLVLCSSSVERKLASDASSIMEKHKNVKSKEELRRTLVHNLQMIGYDASICKSRWEKSPLCPAGGHEYIDVMLKDSRILIEIEFRSEFEIARSTKSYQALLQSLPLVFVGTDDRMSKIVNLASEAAKRSLKKKGLHFPPWRKSEYMCAKWLSKYERTTCGKIDEVCVKEGEEVVRAWELPEVVPKERNGTRVVTGFKF